MSIRVKELFKPIVLPRKDDGFFVLFESIFLRNWSLSNARWLYGEEHKIGKGNLYLTENQLVEMKCGVRQMITVIRVTYVQKDF